MRANAGYVGAHPPCALGSLVHMGVRVNTTYITVFPQENSLNVKRKSVFFLAESGFRLHILPRSERTTHVDVGAALKLANQPCLFNTGWVRS